MSELESSQGGHGVGGKLISCVVFFGCPELMLQALGFYFYFFFSLNPVGRGPLCLCTFLLPFRFML